MNAFAGDSTGWTTALTAALCTQFSDDPQPGFGSGFGSPTPEEAARLSTPKGTIEAEAVEGFWKLHERVSAGLARRQQPPASRDIDGGQLAWMIDRAAVVFYYEAAGPSRILALRIAIGNRTKSAETVSLSHVTAEIDGDQRRLKALPEELQYHGFTYDDVMHRLEACTPPNVIEIPPNGIATAWLIFPNLDNGTTVPKTSLNVRLRFGAVPIDVNEHQRAVLGLDVDRLGPHAGLTLLTIHGPMNTFNLQSIVDELDVQAAQKVVRAVIRFTPEAPAPDDQLESWLLASMSNAGSDRPASEQLPSITGQIRELHLVQAPQVTLANPQGVLMPSASARVHANDADAVAAALKTTFFTASREELSEQIQHGHPLARAAALIYGSQRLAATDVPMILKYSDDADVVIRQAAIRALREFSEPAAIDRLEELVRNGRPEDAQAAVFALADSRFTAARLRLEQLTCAPEPRLVDQIIRGLASRPRPAWSQTLFEHVHDSSGKLRPEALRALVQLDHPQIVDLLGEGLRSNDENLRDLCFAILARRGDERSYQLVLPVALELLNEGSTDSDVLEFASRTRAPQLIQALLRRLDATTADRAAIIPLLAQMGDQTVGDRLVRQFEKYNADEQAAALGALRSLQHPRFLSLAGQSLAKGELNVRQRTIQELQLEGSTQAEQMLCQAFETSEVASITMNLSNALAGLGTPLARETLQAGLKSNVESRQQAARFGLQNLRASSPGYNYFGQGLAHAQQRQWAAAIELFKVAIELDPYLSDAHTALGDAYLKQEKWKLAEKYYGKARDLDPDNSNIITGQAIAWVMLQRLDDALKLIQSYRVKFEQDNIFRYNAACVYGRGIEVLKKQPESAERQARIAEFQRLALADLKAALDSGFNQIRWMQQDPDLKTVQSLPEFAALVAAAEKKQLGADPDDE